MTAESFHLRLSEARWLQFRAAGRDRPPTLAAARYVHTLVRLYLTYVWRGVGVVNHILYEGAVCVCDLTAA